MVPNKKTRTVVLLIALLCFACGVALAQGPGFDDDVVDTPIDGGVGLVMAAVAGYSVKKIADKRKKDK